MLGLRGFGLRCYGSAIDTQKVQHGLGYLGPFLVSNERWWSTASIDRRSMEVIRHGP